jgi:hypothetical protein
LRLPAGRDARQKLCKAIVARASGDGRQAGSKIRRKALKSLIWRKEKTRLKQPFPVVLATISAQEALFTCKKTPLSARKR